MWYRSSTDCNILVLPLTSFTWKKSFLKVPHRRSISVRSTEEKLLIILTKCKTDFQRKCLSKTKNFLVLIKRWTLKKKKSKYVYTGIKQYYCLWRKVFSFIHNKLSNRIVSWLHTLVKTVEEIIRNKLLSVSHITTNDEMMRLPHTVVIKYLFGNVATNCVAI